MASKMVSSFNAPAITIDQLKTELKKGNVFLLDAREIEEFKVSHLSSAVHVGYKKFSLDNTIKLIPKNKKIVVYCSVGYRSGKVASELSSKGANAFNLKGGIFAWANKGLNMIDAEGKSTHKVHGYSRSWSRWLDDNKTNVKK